MDFITDPAEMTPGERLCELAAILAQGYLRFRRGLPPPEIATSAAPPEPTESRLDSRGEPRPPLDPGLTPGQPVGEEVTG